MIALAVCGCDSYLDRQPDDQLTSKNIFDKKTTTLQYLVNVYTYIPSEWSPEGYGSTSGIAITASDEASCAYTGSRFFALLNHNQLSPLSTHGGYRHAVYRLLYQGISEATYFMSKVQDCPQLTDDEKVMWRGEARFLRAFYYTELLKWNGPVIWLGDRQSDYSDPNVSKVDRSPWSTIVDWLCDEYDQAATELPDTRSSYEIGRATKGSSLAMKARLLMFNASPLFNGQNGTGIYDGIVNKDGEKLFNTEYDENRWRQAAEAAKAVIDMNTYNLVDDENATPLENIHNAAVLLNSPENIFTVQCGGRSWRVGETPVSASGYGGIGLTQKLVDAFAMNNGYYPITNMDDESYDNGAGAIEVDPRSGYTETGSQKFVNPFFSTIPKNLKSNDEPIVVTVYPGGNGEFSMYEDNGNDKAYATAFARTRMTQEVEGNKLTVKIGRREGSYEGMPEARKYSVKIVARAVPEQVVVNGKPAAFDYDGNTLTATIAIADSDPNIEKTVEVTYAPDAIDVADGLMGQMRRIGQNNYRLKRQKAGIVFGEELGTMESTGRAISYYPDRMNELVAAFRANYQRLPQLLDANGVTEKQREIYLRATY